MRPRLVVLLALLLGTAIASVILVVVLTREQPDGTGEAEAATFLVWFADDRELPEAEGIRYERVGGIDELRLELMLGQALGAILDTETWLAASDETRDPRTAAFGVGLLDGIPTFVLGEGDIRPFQENANPSPAAANQFVLWAGMPEHPDERSVPFILAFNRRDRGPSIVEYSDGVFTEMLRAEATIVPTYLVYTGADHGLPASNDLRFEPVADLGILARRILEPGIDGVVLDQSTLNSVPLDRIDEWREAGTIFVLLGMERGDEIPEILTSIGPLQPEDRPTTTDADSIQGSLGSEAHFAVAYWAEGPGGSAAGAEMLQPFDPNFLASALQRAANEVRLVLGGT